MLTGGGERAQRSTRMLHTISVLGVAITLLVFPFPGILAQLAEGPLVYYYVLILAADVPLAIVAIVAILDLVVRRQRPPRPILIAVALVATLAVALLIHPSPQGVQTVLRLAAVVALAAAVTTFRGFERALAIGALGVSAIVQTALSLAQLAHGGPLGLSSHGEFADPLSRHVDALAPRGTMYHEYILAGLALVAASLLCVEGLRAARPWPWLVAAALAIIPVGLSYSRNALLGLVVLCAALAIGMRRRPWSYAFAIALLLAGAGIPAFATLGGWVSRSESTLLNGRDGILGQGLVLLATAPVTGIGPGRSVIALRAAEAARPGSIVATDYPVHNVPILAAVEGGPLAGILATALLAVLAWRVRARPAVLAVFVCFLPYLLLDHYPYTYAQGLVLFGMWLGVLSAPVGDEVAATSAA